jgi:hypothetical protein
MSTTKSNTKINTKKNTKTLIISTKNKKILNFMPPGPLDYPLHEYPVAFIDYMWIMAIYITVGFMICLLINGYLLSPFNIEEESKDSSLLIFSKILLQFCAQGFISIMFCAILQKIPSLLSGFFDYDSNSTLGVLIRSPTIVTVLLFFFAQSLQARLRYLFSRFDANHKPAPAPKKK